MIFGKKIIFFKTSHPTALKFSILVHDDNLFEIWANCGEICNVAVFKAILVIFGQKIIFFKTDHIREL